jgi:Tfp pilus assembly PilM family ATPase
MAILSNQAGINLTISKLQLIELGWNDNGIILENADEENLAGYIDKNMNEPELISYIQNAYNQIILRKPLAANSVSFTLPTQLFDFVELPIDDLLTKEDLADHLNWEYSVLFPLKDPSDMLLRYFEIGSYSYPNTRKVLTAAIEKRILGAVHKFCVANNLLLRFVDNVHFAANLLLGSNSAADNYLSIYSDDGFYTMMIFEKGKPKYFKAYDERDLNSIIIKMHDECDEYVSERNLKFNTIFLSGESINDNVTKTIENHFKLEIRKINPFVKLTTAPNLVKRDLITNKPHIFTAPVGIAARIS